MNYKELYLYISSKSCEHLYPDNDSSNFRVRLPTVIRLQGTKPWSVALLDIDLPKPETDYKPVYIVLSSSVCAPTVYHTTLQPVLQRIYFQEIKSGKPLRFEAPRYVPVNIASLEIFDLCIFDDKGQRPSFKSGHLSCTLHLRQDST